VINAVSRATTLAFVLLALTVVLAPCITIRHQPCSGIAFRVDGWFQRAWRLVIFPMSHWESEASRSRTPRAVEAAESIRKPR
jgi:hypothetical protein